MQPPGFMLLMGSMMWSTATQQAVQVFSRSLSHLSHTGVICPAEASLLGKLGHWLRFEFFCWFVGLCVRHRTTQKNGRNETNGIETTKTKRKSDNEIDCNIFILQRWKTQNDSFREYSLGVVSWCRCPCFSPMTIKGNGQGVSSLAIHR